VDARPVYRVYFWQRPAPPEDVEQKDMGFPLRGVQAPRRARPPRGHQPGGHHGTAGADLHGLRGTPGRWSTRP